MVAFQSRSGGCCCGLLDLGEGSEVLVQPLRSGSFLNGPGLLRYRRPKTTVPGWRERLLCCKCGSREVDIVVTGTERAAGLFGRSPMSTGDIDSLAEESGFELGVPPSFSPLARQSERRSRSVRRRTRPLVRRDQRFESAFLPRRVKRTRTPSRGLHSAVTSES